MSSIFKQSIFSFRKLKGIGLASVILGALLVAGPVHADSTTWDNGETSITVYDGHAKSFTNGKTAKELYDEKQYREQPYEDNDSKQQKLYPYENKPVNQDGEQISPSQIVASETPPYSSNADKIEKPSTIQEGDKTYHHVGTNPQGSGESINAASDTLTDPLTQNGIESPVQYGNHKTAPTTDGMMQSDKINYSKIKGRTWLIEKTGDKQYGNYTLIESGTSLSDDKITELTKGATNRFTKEEVERQGGLRDTDTLITYENNTYIADDITYNKVHNQAFSWDVEEAYNHLFSNSTLSLEKAYQSGLFPDLVKEDGKYKYKNAVVEKPSKATDLREMNLIYDTLLSGDQQKLNALFDHLDVESAELIRDYVLLKSVDESNTENVKRIGSSNTTNSNLAISENDRPIKGYRYEEFNERAFSNTGKVRSDNETLLRTLQHSYNPYRLDALVKVLDSIKTIQEKSGTAFVGFVTNPEQLKATLEAAKVTPNYQTWLELINALNDNHKGGLFGGTSRTQFTLNEDAHDVITELLRAADSTESSDQRRWEYHGLTSLVHEFETKTWDEDSSAQYYANEYGNDALNQLLQKLNGDTQTNSGLRYAYIPNKTQLAEYEDTYTYHQVARPLKAYRLNAKPMVLEQIYSPEIRTRIEMKGDVIYKYYDEDGNLLEEDRRALDTVIQVKEHVYYLDHNFKTVTISYTETPTGNKVHRDEQTPPSDRMTLQKDGKIYEFDHADRPNYVPELNSTFNYVYRVKKAPIVTHYRLENSTTELSPSVTENIPVLYQYSTTSKDIPNKVETEDLADRIITHTTTYERVKTPDNAKGEVTESGDEVIYYYKAKTTDTVTMKQAPVVAHYYLANTTDKLSESYELGNLTIGSKYTTESKVIPPKVETFDFPTKVITRTTTYELVNEPSDKQGITPIGGKTVAYFYSAHVNETITLKNSKGIPEIVTPKEFTGSVNGIPEENIKPEFTGSVTGIPEENTKPEFTGSVNGVPEVLEIPEFTGSVNGIPEVLEIPESTGSVNGIPEEAIKPEFTGSVNSIPEEVITTEFTGSVNGIPEVLEIPEFTGSVNGIPEEVTKPEFTGAVNGIPEEVTKPEFTDSVNGIPEEVTKPEFNGSVNGIPEENSKPEFIGSVPEENNEPISNGSVTDSHTKIKAELPKTGESKSLLSIAGLLGLVSIVLSVLSLTRKQDN